MTNPKFLSYEHVQLNDLIDQYPLAWVLTQHGDVAASPLPMIAQQNAQGELVSLVGHLARTNPLVAAFEVNPHALFLFSGPAGYITPDWVSKPGWAPTWNYTVVRIRAEIELDDAFTDEAVRMLVDKMESKSTQSWTIAQMGERYQKMLPAIIGFRAAVHSISATFKMGQDEDPHTLREIIASIGDAPLACWMTRLNLGDCA